eukprot:756465-Hanusia_phi.AAC.4
MNPSTSSFKSLPGPPLRPRPGVTRAVPSGGLPPRLPPSPAPRLPPSQRLPPRSPSLPPPSHPSRPRVFPPLRIRAPRPA